MFGDLNVFKIISDCFDNQELFNIKTLSSPFLTAQLHIYSMFQIIGTTIRKYIQQFNLTDDFVAVVYFVKFVHRFYSASLNFSSLALCDLSLCAIVTKIALISV